MIDEISNMQEQIKALQAENARLRAALEWYAALSRYDWPPGAAISELEYDHGQRARAALASQEPGE